MKNRETNDSFSWGKRGVGEITFRKRLAFELWRQHEKNMRREHPLRQLFWECTLRCDLHCRHCGSDCKMQPEKADMPKEDFLRVLDTVAAKTDPHRIFVIISGGEPLMRQDLEACGAAIYAKGFPWGMVTNALHLTPTRFQRLLQAGMHAMTVSLDGLEEDHNWMRGNPNRQTRKEGRIHVDYGCEGFLGNLEGEVRDRIFSCQAGVIVGSVLADGSIGACPSIRADYTQGNIYEDDFMEVWEHRFLPYRNRQWMKKDECADCRHFRYCQGNGMHLHDSQGRLLFCHLHRLEQE